MSTVDASGLLRLASRRLRRHAPHTELRSAHEATRPGLEVLA
ncbi:hypothetical protein ATK17_1796 [Branchiibius hedensis]|uniref:Uncharacterized protein n=1 Tax=Branchiibius hedensis TaxID=672460 RepID=A0A2Y9C1K3_9MICO|nr:hypothetical protein ATK17_1796 [Branchiibius hedensis]SSA34473.1 hypothetical protein SAMN04489750_1796 [Branchiibius hedensis]